MHLLRHHPGFRRLWAANFFGTLGGWALGLALSVHVFTLTQSPVATGALVVVSLLPAVLFGSASGVLADRVDRVLLMRWVTGMRIVVVALLLPASQSELAILILAALHATVMQFFVPAEQATVASLVSSDDLPGALGLNSAAINATRLAAPAAGGALMSTAGYGWTILCILGAIAVSAALLLRVPRRPPVDRVSARALDDLRAGLGEIRRNLIVRKIAALQLLDGVKEGALSALFPALMLGTIGTSASFMGVVNSSFALTAIIAGPSVTWIVRRFGYRLPIAFGTCFSAALIVGLAALPSSATAFAAFALSGFPFTVSWVAASTLLLLSSNDAHRSRTVGTLGGAYAGVTAASAGIAGMIAATTGPSLVLLAAGTLQLVIAPTLARGLPHRADSTR